MTQPTHDLPDPRTIAPAFGRPVNLTSIDLKAFTDEAVTAGTTQIMRRLATEDADSPEVAALAAEATKAAPRTDLELFDAVFWTVKNHVKYVGDEEAIEPFDFFFPPDELLIRPAELVSMARPQDDCDGFSMLICSILTALGYDCAFKTVAAAASTPKLYSHVYALGYDRDGTPYPLDGSHAPGPGLEVEPVYKARVWPVTGRKRADKMKNPLYRPPNTQQARQVLRGLSGDGGGMDWQSIIDSTFKVATPILTNRYGIPPAGTYINRDGKGNEVISTTGGAGGAISNVTGISTTTMLMIGAGLFAVLILAKK